MNDGTTCGSDLLVKDVPARHRVCAELDGGCLRGSRPSGDVGYRVADDQAVLEAAEEVFEEMPVVETQHRLAELVLDRLQDEDPDYRVSQGRVRRLVLDNDLATVRTTTGRTSRPPPETCPVCEAELSTSKNRTLDGRETVIGTRCDDCGYGSGPRLQVPLRYEFVRDDDGEPEIESQGPF